MISWANYLTFQFIIESLKMMRKRHQLYHISGRYTFELCCLYIPLYYWFLFGECGVLSHSFICILKFYSFFSIEAACAAHPTADVFINFASFRRLVLTNVLVLLSVLNCVFLEEKTDAAKDVLLFL